MVDSAIKVAMNESAPADEQHAAIAEIQQVALSNLDQQKDMQYVVNMLRQGLHEQSASLPSDYSAPARFNGDNEFYKSLSIEDRELHKALKYGHLAAFPSHAQRENKPGMQSVYLDEIQVTQIGEYYEKPGILSYEAMRAMADQTPIISAIVATRIRQVQRFCHQQAGANLRGYNIKMRNATEIQSEDDVKNIQMLNRFIQNCGFEFKPRARSALRRDDFMTFMSKLVRDSLTLDSAPIETEWKKDRKQGLDGFYAVDGATIRLTPEGGFKDNPDVFALQVVQGRVRAPYTRDELIYVPRNPRTDVLVGGYGMSELEVLFRVITGFLNALTYNAKFFESNTLPKGVMHLIGNYSEQDLNAFRRYWISMQRGAANPWHMPVMASRDKDSKATFEKFGIEHNEMAFSKWMNFLVSIACAVYGISPESVSFSAFSPHQSMLSGNSTKERLELSDDSGLVPLLAYFEGVISDYIIQEFDERYAFAWTGLVREDEDKKFEALKLVSTVNEMRARDGMEKLPGLLGNAPVNPSLMQTWQNLQIHGKMEVDPASSADKTIKPVKDVEKEAPTSETEQPVAKSTGIMGKLRNFFAA